MPRLSFSLPARVLTPLVTLVTMSVVATGLQMPAQAAPEAPSPSVAPAGDDSTRPDTVSAMVTAQATGKRVEDLSQRTETVRVFANPDGTWTSDGTTEPERVQDATGAWHEVDTNLVENEGGFTTQAALGDLVISGGGDQVFAALTDERGKRLQWRWPTVLPAPAVKGDTATYVDALPGVGDLVVTATTTGFTHNIVIPKRPKKTVKVTIPMVTRGAELVENPGGEVAVETPAGDTVVAAARPLMWDSSKNAGGDPEVAPVDAAVGKNRSGIPTLTLSPLESFLADPETVYPVVVDPSFTINPSGDTWIQYPNYTSSQSASAELKAGTYDGGAHKARSFLRFDNGNTKWDKNKVRVLDAELKLRNYYSGSCTGAAIRVNRIIEAWTVSGLTWGNQPSVGGMSADYSPAKGYNSSCPGGDAVWNLTEIVQAWNDGGANHGIRLKAVDEGSNFTWRRYRSANAETTGVRPRLTVTYNSYPNKAGTPAVSPGNSGYATSATPTFKATVSDPDKGNVRGVFEVYQGSTLKWTGTSAYVSSGSTASKTMPSGILANGTTYTVKVKANDGPDSSRSYSASTTFTVDTSKPTVAVTSSAFTNGTWTTEVPASNTFTFNGPADTKSFKYKLDTAAEVTKAADSNGDATISWLPKSGSHKLTVTATDKAGNTGAASTFTFGVGPASFNAPGASAQSTAVFPVQVSGPPNATGATLSWRYAGQTTWNAAEGVTKNGLPWTGEVTSSTTDSNSGALLWDATAQSDPAGPAGAKITAPSLLELRTCFTYATTPSQVCSTPRQVQLVPSAFGGTFPTTTLGPATVALFTGEMALGEADAVDTAAGVGRTFATFDHATAEVGPFGPGWSTSLLAPGAADAELVDHRAKDRTFVVVTAGGSSQMFTAADPNADLLQPTGPVEFRPAGTDDGSRLVLEATTVTLTRPQASTTTWDLDGEAWVLAAAGADDDPDNAPETSFEFTDPGYPTWIAQTEPGAATTCTEAEQAPGCRGLKISYTGTGPDRRVSTVERIAHDTPAVTLASYSYTPQGLLDTVCGGDPDGDGPLAPLCSSYEYDTTTVSGRTLLKAAAPPGQKPWQFTYDTTGRLATVARALDDQSNTGTGPATWSVRYDLAPATVGLPDLSPEAVAQWSQDRVPSKAFAVFDPSDPNTTDLTHAQLWYTDTEGTTTNTAVHGNTTVDGSGTGQWLVDTHWYDDHGNIVRSLDGAGFARVMQADPSEREDVASQASTYTVYNDDGDEDLEDGDGTRVEDEYGPVHTVTLKDGTVGPYRAHTAYVYDDEAPALGGGSKPALPEGETAFNLVVETRHSATGADQEGEYDTTVVRNEYDPFVAGDGNGWDLGTPTRTKVQLDDGSWSATVTRHDPEGRLIETRQPGGATASDGSGSDAHATVMSYYRPGAGADPDCRTDDTAHPERKLWDGLLCKSGPAGQPAGPPMPVTHHAAYNDELRPTRVVETSGSTTRTTTTSYDDLGRATSTTITDGTDTRTTAIDYDPATGMPTTATAGGTSVATQHDSWGRPWTYTDATGLISTTTYTTDGQVATRNDGVGTYTYGFDGPSGEHRRLPTSVSVGLPGDTPDTFGLTFDAAGAQSRVTYPNGMLATYGYDDAGVPTSLEYAAEGASEPLLAFTNILDVDGRVVAAGSDASEQDYTYDALGRLTQVQDARDGQCATRTYGFRAASERTAFASYGPDSEGACQTATPTVSKTSGYDAANRIIDTGYSYDELGRTLTVPAADTAAGATGALTAAYYANDMVKQLTQAVDDGLGGNVTRETSYGLDPTGRIDTVSNKADGIETDRLRYRFSDESDAPTSIQTSTDAGATWSTTRYVSVPGIGMFAALTDTEVTFQIANLHGDIVATQLYEPGTLTVDTYNETDEYGNAVEAALPPRYGWLGVHQRSADAVGGLVLMGARVYNPATGLFLSSDPVLNGGANRYSYPTDPINLLDLMGTSWRSTVKKWADRIAFINNWTIGMIPGWLCSVCGAVYLVVAAAATVMYFVAGYPGAALKNAISAGLGYLGSAKLARTYVGKHMKSSVRVKIQKYLGPGLYSSLINIVF